MKQSTDS